MFVDVFMLELALSQLPDEAWRDWTVGRIADELMKIMEDQEG